MSMLAIQLGSVAATVALARLLTPAEFGIIALAQSVLGAAKLFSLTGVRASLVTRQGAAATAADTLFWMSVGFASLVWLVVAFAAVPVTRWLGEPGVAPYVQLLAGAFFFTFISNVPLGLLQRSMRFRAYHAALVSGAMVYFVSEVALALLGLGAWSVIVGQVLDGLVTLAVACILARWWPRLRFSSQVLRQEARFLGGVTGNAWLMYLQRNVDYWVVSRMLGGVSLGIYYIAYVLPNIVRQRLTAVTNSVLLPAFASSTQDQERLTQLWCRSWVMQAGIGFPALLGIAAMADPVVAVFFGSQWESAVAPLQILTVVALVDVHMSAVNVMAVATRSVGWNSLVFGVRAALTLVLAAVAASLYGSLVAVAWAVAIASLLAFVVQELTASRHLGVGLSLIAAPLAVYLGLSLTMALAVTALVEGTPAWPPVVQLIAGVLLGVTTYLGFGLLIARRHMRPLMLEVRRLVSGS